MNNCPISSEWCTPDDLFNVLDKGGVYQGIPFDGFNFDIDLCATKENSKCNLYCTDYLNNKYNNLTEEWSECGDIEFDNNANLDKYGDRPYYIKQVTCWLNPPYGNPKPFIEKAWDDSKHCKIVCLVKCDPSTQWWATFWNYQTQTKIIRVPEPDFGIGYEDKEILIKPGPKPGCSQPIYLPKRIKFDPPQQLIDSKEVWDLNCSVKFGLTNPNYRPKWVQKCKYCGHCKPEDRILPCECKNKGYKELSGPAFSCCLIIMDRRNV